MDELRPLLWIGVIAVTIYIQSNHATSVLEFPTCGKKVSRTDSCVSSDNPLITASEYSRSDIECLKRCIDNFPSDCSAVYRDNSDGTCHIINDIAGAGVDRCTSITDRGPGRLMQMISKNANDNCGNYTCPNDQICIDGCASESLSTPICVADQRDTCDQSVQFLNARHFYNTAAGDSRDSDIVWTATFPKMRHGTGLRIIQHVNIRGHHNNPDKCHYWYITIDGNKCTIPASIEVMDYSECTGSLARASDPTRRVSTLVDGTCWGLAAGDRVIESFVDTCDGYATSDAFTGWNSPRSTIVMEVVPTSDVTIDAAKSCPSSIAFNYQYYTWNEESDLNFNSSSTDQMVKSVIYKKTASDTSLRLKYNALLTLKVQDSGLIYCGRWFIAINGTECDPQADITLNQGSPGHWDYWRHHRRTRTIEGICDNSLDAGVYSIEIWVGNTLDACSQPANFISGGFNSPSRLHVEEVRTDQKVDAIYGPNSRLYKSMYANIKHWQWYAINDDQDDGDLLSVTYYKEYADTGLRLTSNGDHRHRYTGSYSQCGRWYFKIDGIACSNPGVIEGVSVFNFNTNYHQTMQVSGVCHGIEVGSRTITYAVGLCSGYHATDAYTGWESSFHVFVEEIRVDLVKDCGSTIPVNCDD